MKSCKYLLMNLFVLTIMLSSGCANNKQVGQPSANSGKGRYMETKIDLPEIEEPSSMFSMKDGTLCICDTYNNKLFQSDQSHSEWTEKESCILSNLGDFQYVYVVAFSPNGDCMVSYIKSKSDLEEGKFNTSYAYISADGKVTDLKLDLGDETFIREFEFSQDNRIFAHDISGKVFEIDKEKGVANLLFTTNTMIKGFDVTKDYLIVNDDFTIFIYDLNKNELRDESDLLTQFLKEQNFKFDEGFDGDNKFVFFCEDEDKSIFILCKNGLFHYLGGEKGVEQIIDGNLNSINNPSYDIKSIVKEADGSFLILYKQGIMRYTYDSTISSIPEKKLKVYSLTENKTVRQTISQFQTEYPDYYVDYEIGMAGLSGVTFDDYLKGITQADGVTYEDALKNLNTQLLSGDGPDVIVLDDLNIENYVKKGVLCNLMEDKESLNPDQNLLTNVTESLTSKEGLYAVPVKYEIPMLVTKNDLMDKITDFNVLADEVEKIRKEDTDSHISYLCTEDEVLDAGIDYFGDFYSESGLDEEKLTDMLTSAKKIYDNELIAFNEESMMNYRMNRSYTLFAGSNWEYQVAGRALNLITNKSYIATGRVNGYGFNLSNILTLCKEYDGISYQYGLTKNDERFYPNCILGVTSTCNDKEAAINFIAAACSKEVQCVELEDGLSVNKDVIGEILQKGKLGEKYGNLGAKSDTGESFIIEIMYPDEQQGKELMDALEKLDTPEILDKISVDTIKEIAPKYLNGEITVEDAIKQIADKTKIRLAE